MDLVGFGTFLKLSELRQRVSGGRVWRLIEMHRSKLHNRNQDKETGISATGRAFYIKIVFSELLGRVLGCRGN